MSGLILTHAKNYHDRNIIEELADYKNIEYSIVAFPYTIIDPRAMVVEPFNALIAIAAMETPWRPYQATLRAQLCRIHSP